jgi:hypothetical protein
MGREVRPVRIVRLRGEYVWIAHCVDCNAEIQGEIDRATGSCVCGSTVRLVLNAVLWGESTRRPAGVVG